MANRTNKKRNGVLEARIFLLKAMLADERDRHDEDGRALIATRHALNEARHAADVERERADFLLAQSDRLEGEVDRLAEEVVQLRREHEHALPPPAATGEG